MSVTLKATELVRILGNVLPGAGTDDTIPALKGIQLKLNNAESTLTAAATDRYVAFTDTAATEPINPGEHATWSALVNATDVADVLRTIKSRKYGAHVLLTLELEDQDTAHGWLKIICYGDHVRSVELVNAEFPRLEALWPTEDKLTGHLFPFAVNPGNLAKLAKVKDPDAKLPTAIIRCQDNPNRPFLVTMGATFRALIMPIRLPDSPVPTRGI